ncbi:hypothetical protein QHL1GM_18790 [Halomonas sp. QHL1]|nr:hypothetical protein QHL1GM_18790 [Halomonas sp. QHL1]
MQLVVTSVLVPDPQNVILVGVEAGKRDRLEPIHDVALLIGCDLFTGGKTQNARLVLVLEAKRVN